MGWIHGICQLLISNSVLWCFHCLCVFCESNVYCLYLEGKWVWRQIEPSELRQIDDPLFPLIHSSVKIQAGLMYKWCRSFVGCWCFKSKALLVFPNEWQWVDWDCAAVEAEWKHTPSHDAQLTSPTAAHCRRASAPHYFNTHVTEALTYMTPRTRVTQRQVSCGRCAHRDELFMWMWG